MAKRYTGLGRMKPKPGMTGKKRKAVKKANKAYNKKSRKR